MAGAAVTIALQQLKGLLGIKKFTKKTDVVSVLRSVFSAAHHGVTLTRNLSLSSLTIVISTNCAFRILQSFAVEFADYSYRDLIPSIPSTR